MRKYLAQERKKRLNHCFTPGTYNLEPYQEPNADKPIMNFKLSHN